MKGSVPHQVSQVCLRGEWFSWYPATLWVYQFTLKFCQGKALHGFAPNPKIPGGLPWPLWGFAYCPLWALQFCPLVPYRAFELWDLSKVRADFGDLRVGPSGLIQASHLGLCALWHDKGQ